MIGLSLGLAGGRGAGSSGGLGADGGFDLDFGRQRYAVAGPYSAASPLTFTTPVTLTADGFLADDVGNNVTMALGSWFNRAAGTLIVEAKQVTLVATSLAPCGFNSGDSANQAFMYRQSTGAINGFGFPGTHVLASTENAVADVFWRGAIALTASTGDVKVCAKGAAVQTANWGADVATLMTAVTQINVGAAVPGGAVFGGYVRRIRYIPRVLSDVEMIAATV